MSNTTSSTLWCWLLNGRNATERAADTDLVLALYKGADRLGGKGTGDVLIKEGVMFDAFGLTIHKGSNRANNTIDEKGEGAGEVNWSLGHRPFVLMVFAKQELDRLYPANEYGDPKLTVADESMRLIPALSCWSDFENYLTPFVAHGVDLEQARLDLEALGLIGSPMAFGLDDDDDEDDDFILLTA